MIGGRKRFLQLLAGGFLVAAAARGQISPGPLSAAHADLDGSRNCLECHTKGEGVSAPKCFACHEILALRVRSREGLHAQPGYDDCRLCHIEHHGRDYELVWWGEEGIEAFDHDLTGEPLRGEHRELECRECHRAEHIGSSAVLREAGKELGRTFLGLSPECSSCHADEHRGQFEEAGCESCHGVDAFRPAAGFDHDAARFSLTGRHRDVECVECHALEGDAEGETFARFRPVAHRSCAACHRDPHEGALGGDCASCHATESWFSTPGFDHDDTRYPLTGRHRQVACRDCHRDPSGSLLFTGTPFAACSDCHADPHEGRLGAGCAECHVTSGWERVVEGRFDHAATAFPLAGAHARVECDSCHRPGEPLRIAGFERCAACHVDEHLGQFAQRPDGGACESCHSEDAFLPARFSEQDHADSRFPLTGLHRGVACTECHQESEFRRAADGAVAQATKFRFRSLECVECHEDPHEGTTDGWLSTQAEAGGCAACHSDAGWEVAVLDHSRTSFPLEEGHRDVACGECHGAPAATEESKPLILAGVSRECAGCHEDPHRGQFEGREGGCTACHRAVRWADLVFDHGRDSRFALEGAHARADCVACHLPEAAEPEPFVRYAPLPTTCEGCHKAAAG